MAPHMALADMRKDYGWAGLLEKDLVKNPSRQLHLVPETVEFWQGHRSRLHDRLRYRCETGGDWTIERLAP